MKKLEEIFERLGLDKGNGLFITDENLWQTGASFPNRVKRLIKNKIKPDAFFCFDDKPLLLFFLNPSDKQSLHKAIWNFNESPVAIIIEADIVEIYNGFNLDKNTQLLKQIGGSEKLTDFKYFELVTGRTWEQYNEELTYKNRVDYHLLENIKTARKLLVQREKLDDKIANAIIGKSIFVRYLIDRKVKMKFDGQLRTWSNDEFCEILDHPKRVQQFFDYLEDNESGFNGDLFPLTVLEYGKLSEEDFRVLKRLLKGEDIETNQPSLFPLYDFSIIPIEFISNVYELFIGQDNQKKEGAYYTPLFLVDYILKETVEKHLNAIDRRNVRIDALLPQNKPYSYCKVLDPSCGSGIFLVETLRKIIEKYISDTSIDIKSKAFKTAIKNLAIENIFGIDKDLSAIQVAIFSVYLTLLDYLDPPGIETFKFPVLLNTNFFEANFFDENLTFNEYLKKLGFDFILGNPPWGGSALGDLGKQYIKNRKKREKKSNKKFEIAVNNNEIVEGFVLRVSDFCKENTKISLIVRSTILYNLGYSEGYSTFRQYWLQEYYIEKVFELAPVRHEVFDRSNDPSIAPAAIIFYSYAHGENTDKNIIEHIALKPSRFFSLFKIFTINRTDCKKVVQKKLKNFDWLWKVLVYGSYLDFNFIKRLKDNYKTIKELVSDKQHYVTSTGFHSRSKPLDKPRDTSPLIGKVFLKTDAVTPFFIDFTKGDHLDETKVDIVKDKRIYNSPVLLIRNGLDTQTFKAKAAISNSDVIYKNSLSAIKPIKNKTDKTLRNILGILHCDLYSYFAINTFCSIGIEREQTKEYEKLNIPYIQNSLIENYVVRMENLMKKLNDETSTDFPNEIQITKFQNNFNELLTQTNIIINNDLQITSSDREQALMDYALTINRVMITGDEQKRLTLFSPLGMEDKLLKDYSSLFIERFKSKLDTASKKFVVEILHTNQIVGMLFKMVPVSKYSNDIIWINKQNEDSEILSFLSKISSEKITDSLFVQKDIRGFGKDYFFIFKPNERRLWHKAIGFIDVNEFADAILKNGRR